jgi:hypothetical protein
VDDIVNTPLGAQIEPGGSLNPSSVVLPCRDEEASIWGRPPSAGASVFVRVRRDEPAASGRCQAAFWPHKELTARPFEQMTSGKIRVKVLEDGLAIRHRPGMLIGGGASSSKPYQGFQWL